MNRIMIVDDEQGVLNALKRLLRQVPCTYGRLSYQLEVETFSSPGAALERAREQAFDLFLSDYRMPEMNGVQFLLETRALQPDAVRLIISGYADLNDFAETINGANIYRFLPKPCNEYLLVSAIAQALNYRELIIENRKLAEKSVGESEANLASQSPTQSHRETARVMWGPDGSAIIGENAPDATD